MKPICAAVNPQDPAWQYVSLPTIESPVVPFVGPCGYPKAFCWYSREYRRNSARYSDRWRCTCCDHNHCCSAEPSGGTVAVRPIFKVHQCQCRTENLSNFYFWRAVGIVSTAAIRTCHNDSADHAHDNFVGSIRIGLPVSGLPRYWPALVSVRAFQTGFPHSSQLPSFVDLSLFVLGS